ncbi:Flp family type IVb pilin [Vibrio vulnificus]|uniref:Flp family type IVb pilin n=1 Tax=Vibrio vulnificus TaxID=672 RepID=UPI00165DE899|nr:Flp family type IVb pilin [Vibrio vulnificus]EGR0050246.1 Flp family type IVb pilin [Vibrio vulnificus]EGR9007773.1 Flp family type IVb pilin [Vibrio vulnificus]EHU9458687.1 Flp family type IVb pilin [Vibrio vulnificus]ELK5319708.1 Flp family type IVb pilin [Vibrio vulnificus]ELY5141502.1 Flp family type IVb pilin [Vibrio vulnificus]
MFNKVMTKAIEWKLKLENDVRGVTAVEYAIIAVAMSAVLLLIFKEGTLTTAIKTEMDKVTTAITTTTKTQ